MNKKLSTNFSTRQYMRSRDFEIYYYNDNSMSRIENHSHNYYEFYFFLSGDVAIWIEDSVHKLTPGDMILIPPRTPHRADVLSTDTSYERFVFWISEEYCNDLLSITPDYVYLMQHARITHEYVYHFDVITFNTIQYKIFQLIEELHFERFGRNEKISLCVKDLIFHLNRTIYEKEHPATPKEEQKLYQNIISYIEGHLDEDLSLDTLASRFYVSKYHIAHIFKEKLGLSIHQYILKKRLSACRDALLSQSGISEVYMQYGFKDYSSFFRAFKKEYGMSPKDYKAISINNVFSPKP